MTQPEATSMSEKEYKDFLKTMLAEFIADQTDPIFASESREDLEEECLSFGMSLPLVRVIPHEA